MSGSLVLTQERCPCRYQSPTTALGLNRRIIIVTLMLQPVMSHPHPCHLGHPAVKKLTPSEIPMTCFFIRVFLLSRPAHFPGKEKPNE